jgi:hypothetical protein
MSEDDDTMESTAAGDEAADDERTGRDTRGGVSIPGWLAGALVVLLGLAIGAAGFALGRATDDDATFDDAPIVSEVPGGPGASGFPDGPGFPGGGRGGREGPRFGGSPFEDGRGGDERT